MGVTEMTEPSEIIEQLRRTPLFECLSDEDLDAVAQAVKVKSFPKNTILFSEGDESDSFYVICEGRVNVGINDAEGKEIILSRLGAGEYFGEMALMDGEPRSAFVMTKDACRMMILSKSDFKRILSLNYDIMLTLLKEVQRRLREANKKIESLALMDVYGRMAWLLIQLAGSSEPGAMIPDKLTHQEIASMVGASREMVSRVIKDLTNDGYISIRRKRITIRKNLPYSW